ncbi:hypothetical protein SAMN04488121_1011, partial [Chitinophaga filiformis]
MRLLSVILHHNSSRDLTAIKAAAMRLLSVIMHHN